MTELTSNITKGGALLDDTRQFVALWDNNQSVEQNLGRFAQDNLLGLPSLARAADVTHRILRPRFVDAGPDVLPSLHILRNSTNPFTDACYFEASRSEALLAIFAENALTEWFNDGRLGVNSELADTWLAAAAKQGVLPEWSDGRRRKIARGLLAALRDFGRLEGAPKSPNKEIAGPGISDGGFAYVAYRLHQGGESSRGLLTSPVWKRWLLDSPRIDQHMHRIAAQGLLYYARAGSSLRVDWRAESLMEVAHAFA